MFSRVFSLLLVVTLLVAMVASAPYPQYYGGYGLSDPAFNGGTRSTWQDSIVLHLFGRR